MNDIQLHSAQVLDENYWLQMKTFLLANLINPASECYF